MAKMVHLAPPVAHSTQVNTLLARVTLSNLMLA
jgi:hypothetical protein